MPEQDLHTPQGRAAAFAAFREQPQNRLVVKLRRQRAEQLRELLASPETLTLERFNHEIWQIAHQLLLRGTPIPDKLFSQPIAEARAAELEEALDRGDLRIEGNAVWRPASGVYGAMLKEDAAAKEEYIRRACQILLDETVILSERVERISLLPGFGPGSASLLGMVVAPNGWMLDNGQTRGALLHLGLPADNPIRVQISATQLKDELGASDFLELDWFLYRLNQDRPSQPGPLRIWWVNQGASYNAEKAGGFIQAPLQGADGRSVPSWRTLEEVRPGDIILHYCQKQIRAVSQVQAEPTIVTESDGQPRRRISTSYHELHPPVALHDVAEQLYSLAIAAGPIAKDLSVKQGYLFSLGQAGLQRICTASPSIHWPSYVTELLDVGGITPPPPGLSPQPPKQLAYDTLLGALSDRGLFFPAETVSAYLLALQTKGFVILTGISGTGKTQLALELAKQLRPTLLQTITIPPPEGAAVLTAQRYTLQHHQLVLPVDLVDELGVADQEQSGEVLVYYPEGTAVQRLYKYPRRDTWKLVFSDPFRAWFRERLGLGDIFFVDVIPHPEDGSSALRFSLPMSSTQEQPLDSYRVVAVRPDWTDQRGLLGYYNPLTRRYESTPFLRFLLQAQAEAERAAREGREPHPYFLILDEMNLARVEYYFADFLSAMESGEPLELHDDPEIETGLGAELEQLPIPRRLRVPRNLLFTGTVNIDETTSMFSPKVLDRAFTIEFNQVDLAAFGSAAAPEPSAAPFGLPALPGQLRLPATISSGAWLTFGGREGGQLRDAVVALNDLLASEQRHFGYRVANEIARFVNLAAEQTGKGAEALWTALDLAILAKALPKLSGTQQELETLLLRLFAFAVAGAQADPPHYEAVVTRWREQRGLLVAVGDAGPVARFPRTAAKLWRMLRRLRQQGFTAFVC